MVLVLVLIMLSSNNCLLLALIRRAWIIDFLWQFFDSASPVSKDMQTLLWTVRAKECSWSNRRGVKRHRDCRRFVKKENNLTLDDAIAKCRSQEVAWKHCSDMTRQEPEGMAALQITQWGRTKATVGQGVCLGCGGAWHKGGCQQCPAYDRTIACCQKGVTLPRCTVVRQHNRGQYRHRPMLST